MSGDAVEWPVIGIESSRRVVTEDDGGKSHSKVVHFTRLSPQFSIITDAPFISSMTTTATVLLYVLQSDCHFILSSTQFRRGGEYGRDLTGAK